MDREGGAAEFIRKFAESQGIVDLTSRELAQKLDESDDLNHLRNEFHIPRMSTLPEVDLKAVDPNEESIYLCGNSLGLLPKATKVFVDEQLEKWAGMGVFGHHAGKWPWMLGDEACVPGVAALVGAERGEVAMMNGLTVNLHLLLTAFYRPAGRRRKILLESQAFPSDHYAIESQIRLKGLDPQTAMVCLKPREGEDILRNEDILDYIRTNGDEIAVIAFSGVQYYTGQLFDIEGITKAGQEKGCVVGWDLAHAFANVPLQLHAWNVDFACWCTYKYGSSGAGGLAGAFVHARYREDRRDRMLGWWSHRLDTRFQMSNRLELAAGADGWRVSNPPMMLVCGVLGFLKAIDSTNITQLRQRSLKLTGYLEFLIDAHFPSSASPNGHVQVSLITPRDPKQRGCQLSLKFSCDIGPIYEELVKRGCAIDKRHPNVIRVAPVHIYNNFTDCWRFVQVLKEVLK